VVDDKPIACCWPPCARLELLSDPHQRDEDFEQLYGELRKLARQHLVDERPNHTLQATALVHEAFLRLPESVRTNPVAFYRSAALTMRRVLIDHARARRSQKRGGHARIPLDAMELAVSNNFTEVLAVDEAIEALAVENADLADLARLRFFAGLDVEEIARLRKCSSRTVIRDWSFARAWLERALASDDD
jgi:RNA polymerase sigma factor (TIGR02999 family)